MQDSPARRYAPANMFWTAVEVIMVASFLGMLAVMFIQVVARYAIGAGVPWTDETSRFLFIAEIFLGAAIAQRYGEQIRIVVLLDVLPSKVRQIFEIVSHVLVILIAAGLVWGSWGMIDRTSSVMASTLPVPFAWLYAVQGVGVVLMVLLVMRDLWKDITDWDHVDHSDQSAKI
ncbi:TRAP transporter small permease [Puniceibacterium sp. IMCC21224]|uniref:TRAP transporter small permease n=1 Tax=Puniceibacterium sp. IMCC21224 TaxID=1618204 RepID=UPI00064DED06|nr:TRAP transporter small permease [Puniceibacterium sp. IMCC21224]KMK65051.1 TRAP-type C4-dicarboxylate transport system, small permease component [Puniceibacterium sp. IMCC21224]